MENNNNKRWTEWFRVFTPLFLFVLSLLAGGINSKLNDIDNRLFSHLTNDELHCPKSMVVTKAEFIIYQTMREKQMADIKDDLADIKRILLKNGR